MSKVSKEIDKEKMEKLIGGTVCDILFASNEG